MDLLNKTMTFLAVFNVVLCSPALAADKAVSAKTFNKLLVKLASSKAQLAALVGQLGQPGATGAQGPLGQPGPKGATGSAGAQGSAGIKGPDGPQGPRGRDGSELPALTFQVGQGDPTAHECVGFDLTGICDGPEGCEIELIAQGKKTLSNGTVAGTGDTPMFRRARLMIEQPLPTANTSNGKTAVIIPFQTSHPSQAPAILSVPGTRNKLLDITHAAELLVVENFSSDLCPGQIGNSLAFAGLQVSARAHPGIHGRVSIYAVNR